jgi:hypothetical protein
MSALIPWTILLGLTAVMARYLRTESSTHRKIANQQQAAISELIEELTSLRSALLASGTVERSARLPPPSPSPEKPAALPRRVVSVTTDDDPVHVRETKVQPAADALVDATKPDDPPSTKPSTSTARPIPVDTQIDRAQLRIVQAAGPRPPDEDEVTVRASGRPGLPRANEDDDDGDRTADEEGTHVYTSPQTLAKRPGGPLAGVPLERPTSSARRTAAQGRRPTLMGGLLPREPSWVEKRSAQLIAQGASPTEAVRRAEEEGRPGNSSPGAARPPTPTPTEPGREKIDARIERRWGQKVAASRATGKNASHCHGERCLEEGRDVSLCACGCAPCRLVVSLHVQAEREVRAEDDWAPP